MSRVKTINEKNPKNAYITQTNQVQRRYDLNYFDFKREKTLLQKIKYQSAQ